MKRRDFLRWTGAASATFLPGAVSASDGGHNAVSPDSYGVLVDTTVCTGCRKCEFACDRKNELTGNDLSYFENRSFASRRRPDDESYTVVNVYQNPKAPEGRSFVKAQCMHCQHPACASACIVGALAKQPEGPVTYEAWKCIGCRYCMVACPFEIPAYEYDKALEPRVMKCSFCFDRIVKGERPACVDICPAEALTFGKRRDLVDLARSKIIRDRGRYFDHVYGEKEAGGTSWMYLTAVDYAQAGLPDMPYDAFPERTEKIQHGVFKHFLPPIMLYGLLGLIMYSTHQDEPGEGSDHE